MRLINHHANAAPPLRRRDDGLRALSSRRVGVGCWYGDVDCVNSPRGRRMENGQRTTEIKQKIEATTTRPTTNHQPPTTNHQPPTNQPPPTINDQPPTTNVQRPTTNDQRPTSNDQRQTTNDQRPTTNDKRQTSEMASIGVGGVWANQRNRLPHCGTAALRHCGSHRAPAHFHIFTPYVIHYANRAFVECSCLMRLYALLFRASGKEEGSQ